MPEQGSTGQDKDRTIIKQDHCLFQAMIFSHSSGESHFFLVSLALENELRQNHILDKLIVRGKPFGINENNVHIPILQIHDYIIKRYVINIKISAVNKHNQPKKF